MLRTLKEHTDVPTQNLITNTSCCGGRWDAFDKVMQRMFVFILQILLEIDPIGLPYKH